MKLTKKQKNWIGISVLIIILILIGASLPLSIINIPFQPSQGFLDSSVIHSERFGNFNVLWFIERGFSGEQGKKITYQDTVSLVYEINSRNTKSPSGGVPPPLYDAGTHLNENERIQETYFETDDVSIETNLIVDGKSTPLKIKGRAECRIVPEAPFHKTGVTAGAKRIDYSDGSASWSNGVVMPWRYNPECRVYLDYTCNELNGCVLEEIIKIDLNIKIPYNGVECLEGSRCENNNLFKCQNYNWKLSEVCDYKCEIDSCIEDLCEGVVCLDQCNGPTRLFNGYCSKETGECVYDELLCDEECENGLCVSNLCDGVKCLDYCEDSVNYFNGDCVLGECIYEEENCAYGCSDLGCSKLPCEGIICEDYCSNEENTLHTNGQCVQGKCVYPIEGIERYSEDCGFVPFYKRSSFIVGMTVLIIISFLLVYFRRRK